MALPLPPNAQPQTKQSIFDLAKENAIPENSGISPLWHREDQIDGTRFDKLYPYELIVVEQQDDGSYSPKKGKGWRFRLPMPPESLSINTPFAVNTTLTMGGVVEEHSGIRKRMISLSGTFGVFFARDAAPRVSTTSFLQSVFAGTITAAQNTAGKIADVSNAGQKSFQVNVADESDFGAGGQYQWGTGYYQHRLLQYFLEAYHHLKSTKGIAAKRARLAFAVWKDEAVWLVQAANYETHKVAASPHEIAYSLQLSATKRVVLQAGAVQAIQPYVPVTRDPNKLAQALNTLEAARDVLQDASKTIAAVGGDINHSLFEPIRETALFVKDLLSVPLALTDMADSVIRNLRDTLLDVISEGQAVQNYPNNLKSAARRVGGDANAAYQALSDLASERKDDSNVVQAQSAANQKALSRGSHPANQVFNDPQRLHKLLKQVDLGKVMRKPQVVAAVQKEVQRVQRQTRLDFEAKRDSVAQVAADFAELIGAGDPLYNTAFNRPAPRAARKIATDDDFEILYHLNNVVAEMNRLAASAPDTRSTALQPIEYVAGLAQQSGIAFTVPKSKYAVPFPYGSTLEQLALRYLNDPNRWLEIATLNGLHAPYVDEQGFEQPLLVNGSNNTIVVSDGTPYYAGQPVWIQSAAVARTKRRVKSVRKLAANQYAIEVDGDPTLDQYTTIAAASIHAFRPNTVNSQMLIYIPSEEIPQDTDFTAKSIPGIDQFDKLLSVGGIDLLLDSQNNLIVTPDGDTRWAVGLNNIIQKVRLATSVRQGTLLHHPKYGIPLEPGQSVADLDPQELLKAVQTMFNDDPSFEGVTAVRLEVNGPVARLGIAVTIAGTSQTVPVTLEVKQ